MKKTSGIAASMYCIAIMTSLAGGVSIAQTESPIDPCLNCHNNETPKVVQQWEAGKHSKTGVKCYVCHHAEESNKKGMEHNEFFIITSVDVQTCESCHPEDGKDLLSKFSKASGKHP